MPGGRVSGQLVPRGALRALDEPLDLLVGEAGQAPRVLGDRDRHHVVVAVLPGAAQVEALVDRVLELDGLAPPLGIALVNSFSPPQPLRTWVISSAST